MSPTSKAASNGRVPTFGMITLEGKKYLERPQIFGAEVTVTSSLQVLTGLRLSLPGVADFLLKGLSRACIPAPPVVGGFDRYFRFRLYNQEGTTWYFSGGLGIFDDRLMSTLCFGSGQFPYMLIPPIPVHANGNLFYEIEDIGWGLDGPAAWSYPYTIHIGFHGSYLIPVT